MEPGDNKNDEGVSTTHPPASINDTGSFVKDLHNRIFNNISECYILPADKPEWNRLNTQGTAISVAFGGLYPWPCADIIQAVLLPVEGQTRRIVDVGCGTGAWAMQMAIKYPHASVLGLDVAPTPPFDPSSFPPNLSFEIYDINRGLEHLSGQIDLIHMRCVSSGLKDAWKTLEDLQKTLKPGGLVLVVDGDNALLSEDRKTIIPMKRLPEDEGPDVLSVSVQGSWFRRVMWETVVASSIAGADMENGDNMDDLGLWDSALCDPETCRSGGIDLPIGPWAETEDEEETNLLKYVGELTLQNFRSVHHAFRPILLKHGMDQKTLDDWGKHVDEELETLNLKMWVRFRFFMGRRRAGPSLSAPPLPVLPLEPVAQAGIDRKTGRYPALDIYYTREANMERMRQRRATHGVPPNAVLKRRWDKLQELQAGV